MIAVGVCEEMKEEKELFVGRWKKKINYREVLFWGEEDEVKKVEGSGEKSRCTSSMSEKGKVCDWDFLGEGGVKQRICLCYGFQLVSNEMRELHHSSRERRVRNTRCTTYLAPKRDCQPWQWHRTHFTAVSPLLSFLFASSSFVCKIHRCACKSDSIRSMLIPHRGI